MGVSAGLESNRPDQLFRARLPQHVCFGPRSSRVLLRVFSRSAHVHSVRLRVRAVCQPGGDPETTAPWSVFPRVTFRRSGSARTFSRNQQETFSRKEPSFGIESLRRSSPSKIKERLGRDFRNERPPLSVVSVPTTRSSEQSLAELATLGAERRTQERVRPKSLSRPSPRRASDNGALQRSPTRRHHAGKPGS